MSDNNITCVVCLALVCATLCYIARLIAKACEGESTTPTHRFMTDDELMDHDTEEEDEEL